QIEAQYAGVEMYGPFKKDVGEALVAMLEPIQAQYQRIRSDRAYLNSVMRDGAEKASAKAQQTLQQVYAAVGFVARP
ncbi:MAG: tryptophan--tRNA ligase, partial [Vibrio sp.]